MVRFKELVVGATELGCAVCGATLLAVGLGYGLQIERAEAATFQVPIRLSPLRTVVVEEEPVSEPIWVDLEAEAEAELGPARAKGASRAVTSTVVEAAPAAPQRWPEPDDAFRLALRSARPTLERCYENELKKQAPFGGALEIAVQIAADGSIEDARVTDAEKKASPVGQCIAARLRQLRLPRVSSAAEVVVPIRLSAVQAPAPSL